MKKILLLIFIVLAYTAFQNQNTLSTNALSLSESTDSELQYAYKNRQSNLQIQGSGTVIKKLKDDLSGSRHQRFIIKLNSGQTLLVAHNIDLAPKITSLKKGDTIEFYGEYEWNKKGGVIHWTHNDPNHKHAHGWLKHNSITYQ